MKALVFEGVVLLAVFGGPIWCQPSPDPQPIYRVTVVSRTLAGGEL